MAGMMTRVTVRSQTQRPPVSGALVEELTAQIAALEVDQQRAGALLQEALVRVRVGDSPAADGPGGSVPLEVGVALAVALLEVLDEDPAATAGRARRIEELQSRLDRAPRADRVAVLARAVRAPRLGRLVRRVRRRE
jgi:hypothetical protein